MPQHRREHRRVHEGRVCVGGAPAAGPAGHGQPGAEGAVPHLQRTEGGRAPGPDQRAGQPACDLRQPGGDLQRPEEVRLRPGGAGQGQQAGSGHRPGRRNPQRHPYPEPQEQEQPGAHRRARRGQDRHRRGAGPADRQGGRTRLPEGQDHLRPGHGFPDRRGQVPRRV